MVTVTMTKFLSARVDNNLTCYFYLPEAISFPLPGATSTCGHTPSTRNRDTVMMATATITKFQ